MKKLSREQKQLLNTDFGPEIEKIAEDRAIAITNAYEYGFDKYASSVADEMDKLAEEEDDEDEDEDEDEEMDEESEKAAAELGAFIERGFFDGLRKLGAERHNNELHYLAPYIQEKIALSKKRIIAGTIKGLAQRGEKAVRKGTKAVGKFYGDAAQQARLGVNARGMGKRMVEKSRSSAIGAETPVGKRLAETGDQLIRSGTKGALIGGGKILGTAAAGTGAVGYGGYKALGGGKKED